MPRGRCTLATACLLLLHGTFSGEDRLLVAAKSVSDRLSSPMEECSMMDHEEGKCVRPTNEEEEEEEEEQQEPRSQRALLVSRKGRGRGGDDGAPDPDSIDVIFENVADKDFQIFWVDSDGSKTSMDLLNPRSQTSLNTFIGHAFRLQAEDGEVHEFLMEAGVTHIVVPPKNSRRKKSKPLPRKEAAAPQWDPEDKSFGLQTPQRVMEDKSFGLQTPQRDMEDKSVGLQTPQRDMEDKSFGLQTPQRDMEDKSFGLQTPQQDMEDKSFGLQTPQRGIEDEPVGLKTPKDVPPEWRRPRVLGGPGSELHQTELRELRTYSEGFGVMFWNLCDQDIIVFYEDEEGSFGIKQDVFGPGEDVTTATYADSTFCFTGREAEHLGCLDPLLKITVHASKYAYPVDCGKSPKALRKQWLELDKHNKEYFATKGRHWVGAFPQAPPALFMRPAERVGDVATVRTSVPLEPAPPGMADPGLLNVTVISLEPRAFLIPQFLSSAEARHIIQLGAAQVKRSTSGDGEGTMVMDTRTSRNTFLPRAASPIMDRIFSRAADVLGVSDSVITDNSEDMQLVHYAKGQEYTPHHDWWTSKGGSRYITLLMYLNTPDAGGHTVFPKARPAGGSAAPAVQPLAVAPSEGSAVLFYNKLPDGNSDDLALHCSLPVRKGEKWLANFWVWDPVRVDD